MLTSNEITEIFFLVDEYCILFKEKFEKKFLKVDQKTAKKTRNRASVLSNSEVITLLIAFHHSHYRTLKHFYKDYVCVHMRKEFPEVVSYNRFVELQKKAALPLFMFVTSSCLGECTGFSFIDSTKVKVCHDRRIHQHRVFKGIAQRGRTSTGWFYGFKLHIVINDKAEIISFQLTRGNVADNNENLLLKICKDIFGKVYGDKGYIIRESVFEKLFYDGVHLISKIRKNMKNKLMSAYDKIMLRKRSVIECVMDGLKNICQIEHSRHRSIHGFVINIFSAIAAYHFLPKKPSIANQFQTEQDNALQLSL